MFKALMIAIRSLSRLRKLPHPELAISNELYSKSSEYYKHLASRHPGTCQWLQRAEQYKEWHGSDIGTLWIKAIAGSGKSVLAASLISKLVDSEDVPVLHFFFRQTITAN